MASAVPTQVKPWHLGALAELSGSDDDGDDDDGMSGGDDADDDVIIIDDADDDDDKDNDKEEARAKRKKAAAKKKKKKKKKRRRRAKEPPVWWPQKPWVKRTSRTRRQDALGGDAWGSVFGSVESMHAHALFSLQDGAPVAGEVSVEDLYKPLRFMYLGDLYRAALNDFDVGYFEQKLSLSAEMMLGREGRESEAFARFTETLDESRDAFVKRAFPDHAPHLRNSTAAAMLKLCGMQWRSILATPQLDKFLQARPTVRINILACSVAQLHFQDDTAGAQVQFGHLHKCFLEVLSQFATQK